MSQFQVEYSHLNDAALTISHVSPAVTELVPRAAHHAHAGRHTAAARGMMDLSDHFAAVLPHFAAAGAGLAGALAAAAETYEATDQGVADAAAEQPVPQGVA